MRANSVLKTIVALLIVAVLGAGVVFGLYSAGIISLGGSTVDEDGSKVYSISYDLTNVTASESNVTTIKTNGTATLIFTKNYSNYELEDLSVDGAALRYYREDGSEITVVISNPESAVTVTVAATAPWDDGSTSGDTSSDDDSSSGGSTSGDSSTSGGSTSGDSSTSGGSTSGDSSTSSESYTISHEVSNNGAVGYVLELKYDKTATAKSQVVFTAVVTGATITSVVIKYADGTQAGCTSLGDDEYTFVMPSQNVTIVLYMEALATLSIGNYVWYNADEYRTMNWSDSTDYTISATLSGDTVSSYTITLTDEAIETFEDLANALGGEISGSERSGVYTISGSTGTFNLNTINLKYFFYLNQNIVYAGYGRMNGLYAAGTPLIKITVNGASTSASFYLLVNPGDSITDFINAL